MEEKETRALQDLSKQIPASIGFVELIYALQNKISYADLQNKSGKFIKPTLASTSAAANVELPGDMRVAITDTDAANGYPICGFTYILLYREQNYGGRSEEKTKETVKLVWWMTHQGQKFAESLYYAPLPSKAQKLAENSIRSVTYNGQRSDEIKGKTRLYG